MSTLDFASLASRHRNYVRSGATRLAEWRERQLIALRTMMQDRAEAFYAALWTDLRRNRVDADWTDVKYVTSEAGHALARLRTWMKPRPVRTPLVLAPSRAEVRFDPLGVGLIIGTWNYPVMLTLSPLIAAISGGNAAVLKPSEVAPATAGVIARFLPEYLDREAFSVVLGAVPETTALLECRWDHIFFTGGTTVARIVMSAAAKHLTPVVLELGGKSPTIVHSSANLRVAARRIAQGRWGNAGQTCTAPDYVLVFKDVAKPFLEQLEAAVSEFYGSDAQKSPDYGRIVSGHHFDRLVGLLEGGRTYFGGQYDRADRYIAPTVLVEVSPDAPVMCGRDFRADSPGAGTRRCPGGHRFHQRAAKPARPVRLRGRSVGGETDSRLDDLGRRRGERVHRSPDHSRFPVRRRRQFRDGKVPRRLGIPRLHERTRRSAPQRAARPGHPLPSVRSEPAAAENGHAGLTPRHVIQSTPFDALM